MGLRKSDPITGEMPVLAAEFRSAAAGCGLLQVRQECEILPNPPTHSDNDLWMPVGRELTKCKAHG